VHATMGQIQGDDGEHLKLAQQCFQIVGASASECDTIPGRQSMASCFFLLRQFEDVLVYLKSVAEFSKEDDDFHWNFGIANAATGDYKAAEEALESVRDEGYRREYAYLAWLAKTYINNGKAKLAWELYAGLETNDDSFALLRVVADECYRAGAFYYACKAFDVLERLDPVPEFWEGKRGAAMGLFRAIVAGEEPRETVRDIVAMLRNTSSPQVEYFVRTLTKWARENGVQV